MNPTNRRAAPLLIFQSKQQVRKDDRVQREYSAEAAVNIEQRGCSIVTFTDDWQSRNVPQTGSDIRPDGDWLEYCSARESAERRAAKSARSLHARPIHQELAQAYMLLRTARR